MPPLAIAAAVLLPRLAVESVAIAREVPPALASARRFLTVPAEQLIQQSSGLTPELVRTLRERAPADAWVVVYSSLPGEQAAKLLADTYERLQNLVWPHPHRFQRVQVGHDKVPEIAAGHEGRLVVVDAAVPPTPRPELPGRYELLYQDGLLRLWLLREVAR